MLANKKNAGIAGIGMYVPDRVLTNHDLAKMVDTNDAWIQTMTGIRERHIASPRQAASDLGVIAAERALADAAVSPDEVDLIIVATGTADMLFPSTACLIQERLGLKNTPAFDLAAGCSGFIYAIAAASQFVANSVYRTVLVVGTEVTSRLTNWEDRETCVLLADGAGAVVLRQTPPGQGILSIRLGSDGSGGKHLYVPAGGSRMPATQQTVAANLHTWRMNGQEVFKFAMRAMPEATRQALKLANIAKEDVSLIIPHQANLRIIEAAARSLELPLEKFMINIDRYANTASASIPIALYEAMEGGRIQQGDIVVLTGFGAGLAWGSVVMRWHK